MNDLMSLARPRRAADRPCELDDHLRPSVAAARGQASGPRAKLHLDC